VNDKTIEKRKKEREKVPLLLPEELFSFSSEMQLALAYVYALLDHVGTT